MRGFLIAFISGACVAAPAAASAQTLPSEPVRVLDGRLVLTRRSGGDAWHRPITSRTSTTPITSGTRCATCGCRWPHCGSPPNGWRLSASCGRKISRATAAYAAYVRFRPWPAHRFDIQAGRIPPVFGAFARRSYSSDRILIGYPLAYQYLTSLRADATPATADDLLVMRGRGWRSAFPIGSPEAAPGVPLVSAFRWDTGVQARWSIDRAEAALSVTAGTLSHPRLSDDNDSKQVSARVAVKPIAGLVLGASGARGGWISRDVPVNERRGPLTQSAFGVDAEYSRDYWILRGEMVWSRWRLPFVTPPPEGPSVDAIGASIEGRYRITPRWYAAARADRLGFSKITGSLFQGPATAWEAPVLRYEAGGGYYFQRNIVARGAVQWNHRDGGRVRSRTFLTGQVAYWF